MPFIVQCPYCSVRSKVPDHALGGSGRCTRCSNFFTLTPAEDQRVPELVGSPLEASSSDLEPVASSSMSAAIAEADEMFEPEFETEPELEDESEPAPEGESAPRKRVHPATAIGAGALLCGACALASAAFTPLAWFVLPLSALGVAAGIVALLVAWSSKNRGWQSRSPAAVSLSS